MKKIFRKLRQHGKFKTSKFFHTKKAQNLKDMLLNLLMKSGSYLKITF